MIELTTEQQESIQGGKAVRVRENGREYVMLDDAREKTL